MKRHKTLRGIALATLFGVLVYAILLFVSDWRQVGDALAAFDVGTLALVLGLTLICYFSRTIRLRYLMGVCETQISWKDALYIQFSGMTMTITPGKVGEVLKAFLANELTGLPLSRGIALVLVERMGDLLAVLVISVGGLALLDQGVLAFAIAAGGTTLAVFLLSRGWFHTFALRFLERRKRFARYHLSAGPLLSTIHTTLQPRPLAISMALSIVGWGSEAFAFHLTLRALSFDGLSLFPAMAVYAVSTIAGALAMFPGGLGLTEGSMMGILVASGASSNVAFSATMIIRFATLWFGVAIGWVVFATRPALMRGFLSSSEAE